MPDFLSFFKKNKSTNLSQEDQQKSYQLIHGAIKKAQAILSSAELEAIKVVADTRFELKHSIQEEENSLQQSLQEAQQDYLKYLQFLKESADSAKNAGDEAIRERVEGIFVKFEEKLADFLTQTQQRSVDTIDLEIKAARNLIETYKEQQLKIIDENIVAILERTLSLVLAKKLTLQDQLDLIMEGLEKAKQEKFIV